MTPAEAFVVLRDSIVGGVAQTATDEADLDYAPLIQSTANNIAWLAVKDPILAGRLVGSAMFTYFAAIGADAEADALAHILLTGQQ